MDNIFNLIPKDKSDNSCIEKLKKINIDEVEPILGELLKWIQDINWPIAQELVAILPRFSSKLIPHIRCVFESDDDIWKCYTLCLLKDFPVDSVKLLHSDIVRIAKFPTNGEMEEGANEYAIEVIRKFDIALN